MQNSEITFARISADDPIAEVIKQAFDMELNVSGGWGYDKESAIVIGTHSTSFTQLQHTLASMRTHLEMSMTLPKGERYGGINLSELSRKKDQYSLFEAVTYRVTAMLESDYTKFIAAYKDGYGTEGFDIEKHFQEREKATLMHDTIVWFKLRI